VSGEKDVENRDTADRRSKSDRRRFLKDPRMYIDALPSIFRVVKDLIGAVHIERLLLNITLGLDDPAKHRSTMWLSLVDCFFRFDTSDHTHRTVFCRRQIGWISGRRGLGQAFMGIVGFHWRPERETN